MIIGSVQDHYRVERVLLAHPRGIALADIARRTGMKGPTILNHLNTMRRHRRAEQLPDKTWRPTPDWCLMLLSGLAADANASADSEA